MCIRDSYSSPYFVTDEDRLICEFENPSILITDKKISSIADLIPVLETVQKNGTPLIILAEEVEGEALATLVVNKNRGVLQVAAVRAPSFGERRKAALGDIAVLTGGTLISEDKAMSLEKVQISDLGQARRVTITKDSTTIVANENQNTELSNRIASIKRELDETDSEYDQEKLNERIAKLAGGVAVIKVGAPTETELKNRKLRIEDALNATRAAIEEGIVAGGGVALIRARKQFDKIKAINDDELTGIQIISRALEAPLRTIVENAGGEGSVVVAKILDGKNGFGYDAKSDKYVDLFESGIIDPKKVTRVALENAASVAGMILTTECALVDIKEDAPAAPPMGGGGMPGMM